MGNWTAVLMCWILFWSTSSSTASHRKRSSSDPLLLLISFDGFRWDYLDRTETPNFDSLIADGVKAEYIYDVFVSKTFPNHYSIATGLYEESHGLVGNNMYDPDSNDVASLADMKEPEWWDQGEPIWVTNQQQGGNSGVVMYPGMDVRIRGVYPTYRDEKYNASVPFEQRVDTITELFANGSINLGLLYFHEPDHSGHFFGPDSPKMDSIIQMCDSTVGYLMKKLQDANLQDRVNVIITSDHGMTSVSSQNFTQLDDFVDPSLYMYTNNNPVIGIWPYNESDIDVIYKKLVNASPQVMVYKKEDLPDQFHYKNNRRISPIVLIAKEGWSIFRGNILPKAQSYRGNHGFNNSLMSMHPIFVAHGPAFGQGLVVKPFQIVNIYSLMCHILGLKPAPNNGSLEKVKDMLSSTMPTFSPTTDKGSGETTLSSTAIISVAVVAAVAVVAVCLVLAMCVRQRSYRQAPMHYSPIADTSLEVVPDIPDAYDSGFSSYNYPNTKI